VWFPDPEVSGTRLFSAHDTVESSGGNVTKKRSRHSRTKMLLNMRRKGGKHHGAVISHTTIHDDSPVSSCLVSSPNTASPYAKG